VPPGSTIHDLLEKLHQQFPKLSAFSKSTLIAVGVDYQRPEYLLQPGDQISLFPPVQGG
jgi:molybdopterin converting factor small subunit